VTLRGIVLCTATALLLLGGPAAADEAATYYHKAMAYKQQGKVDDAIRELRRAIELRQDYAAAHYSLGILYRQKREDQKAIFHLEEGPPRFDPKAAQSHLQPRAGLNQRRQPHRRRDQVG